MHCAALTASAGATSTGVWVTFPCTVELVDGTLRRNTALKGSWFTPSHDPAQRRPPWNCGGVYNKPRYRAINARKEGSGDVWLSIQGAETWFVEMSLPAGKGTVPNSLTGGDWFRAFHLLRAVRFPEVLSFFSGLGVEEGPCPW